MLSRRHLLAGTAATAAVAVMPAVAIAAVAAAPFDLERFIAVVNAETERLHPITALARRAVRSRRGYLAEQQSGATA